MYYVISRSWFWNQNTYSFLNGTRLCRPEISLIMNRNSIDNSFLRQPPYISIYILFLTILLMDVISKKVFILLHWNHYISTIYILVQNLGLPSQTIFAHIFHILIWIMFYIFFGYLIGLYIFFFSFLSFYHLLWRREGVLIHPKLIPDWIGSSLDRILNWGISCPITNQTSNTNWTSIYKMTYLIEATSLTIFKLLICNKIPSHYYLYLYQTLELYLPNFFNQHNMLNTLILS